jgi:hypothetical protein
MAQYTTNYNLYRPSRNDNDIEVDTSLDNNFQIIDAEIKNRANEIGNLSEKIGDINNLNTTAKNNTVEAINEVNTEVTEAREDSINSVTHPTLKDRLDAHANEIGNLFKNKLDWINVRQSPYNLKADGTDETTTLQQAIDDASSNGGVVYLPKGNYGFTELHLKNGVKIIGDGRNKTKLVHLGSGKAIFNNESGVSIGRMHISDLTLQMNANTTIGIEFARVYLSQIERVDITGGSSSTVAVSFDDGLNYSSYYNTCYDVAINANTTTHIGTGFKFSNSANSNRLMNCRTNYVDNPVEIATDYCNHVVILGCAFEQFVTGVRLNGDFCQVLFNRFENGGGSPNGIGIEITSTSGNNVIIGNVMMNLATPVQNNNSDGTNFIFNYSELRTRYISHEPSGGWTSNMDMRNYGMLNVGYVNMQKKTTSVSGNDGRIAYADGSGWNPTGQGEGIYVYYGSSWKRLGEVLVGTTAQRPTTNNYPGRQYFDTTINKPIWRNASNTGWVDATGASV